MERMAGVREPKDNKNSFEHNSVDKKYFSTMDFHFLSCVFLPSFLLFLWDWGQTQGFMLAKQAFYHLSHTPSSFCSGYSGDGGLKNYLPEVDRNYDPPNLSLLSS
jgi:hypothetical protein